MFRTFFTRNYQDMSDDLKYDTKTSIQHTTFNPINLLQQCFLHIVYLHKTYIVRYV
jgi:hypothetical protein